MIKNKRGFFHIHMITVLFFFALIGAWYAWKSYQEHLLMSNMEQVFGDYRSQMMKLITDPNDQARVQHSIDELTSIAAKYGPMAAQPAQLLVPLIQGQQQQ